MFQQFFRNRSGQRNGDNESNRGRRGQKCGVGQGGRGFWRRAGGGGSGGGGGGGGTKPGSGPGGECLCPQCGHKEPHVAGVRCIDQICPNCGTKMIRG